MAKKVHKDRDGNDLVIELTDEDAEKLHKELEEEKKNTDYLECESCKNLGVFKRQPNKNWKCNACSEEIDDLTRLLIKGKMYIETQEAIENAEAKVFGDIIL